MAKIGNGHRMAVNECDFHDDLLVHVSGDFMVRDSGLPCLTALAIRLTRIAICTALCGLLFTP